MEPMGTQAIQPSTTASFGFIHGHPSHTPARSSSSSSSSSSSATMASSPTLGSTHSDSIQISRPLLPQPLPPPATHPPPPDAATAATNLKAFPSQWISRRHVCYLLALLSLALLALAHLASPHSHAHPEAQAPLNANTATAAASTDDSPLAFLPDIDPAWYTLPHDGYRVVFLLCFGALCWAASLVLVERAGVPVARLLAANVPSPTSESDTDGSDKEDDNDLGDALSTAKSVKIGGSATAAGGALVVSGWRTAWGVVQVVAVLGVVLGLAHWLFAIGPGTVYLLSLAVVLAPVNRVGYAERTLLFRGLIRAFTPSLTHLITFSDVLLADFLTSFARVFADIYASLGSLVPAHPFIEPLLVSIPYLIRFRQCLNEALRAPSSSPSPSNHTHSHGHHHHATYLPLPPTPRARHLANALKYFSALPVIYLSAATRHSALNDQHATANAALALWVLAGLVNTWYSIYWDVFLDWSLGVRPPLQSALGKRRRSVAMKHANSPGSASASGSGHGVAHHRDDYLTPITGTGKDFGWPVFTRPRRAFAHPAVYYMAMLADFILRFLWALRLSSHVPSATLMSVAEVARRGMWCVLRMEREWCVAYHGGAGGAGGLFKLDTVKRAANGLLPLPVSSPGGGGGAAVDHVRELGGMVVTARGAHGSSHELGSNPDIGPTGGGGGGRRY
ncbi:EXS family-domain-containing protein, partial [Catenaria anguillulae PL171]